MGESETELCQHAQQEAYAKEAEASREGSEQGCEEWNLESSLKERRKRKICNKQQKTPTMSKEIKKSRLSSPPPSVFGAVDAGQQRGTGFRDEHYPCTVSDQ